MTQQFLENKKELLEIFKKLNAPDPESWTDSQIEEGINQLDRYIFLKGAWDRIVKHNDVSWIDSEIKNTSENSNEPFDGIAHSLRRLINDGAKKEDITELVRNMQAQFLFDICYMLDDALSVEGNEDYTSWGLFKLDEDYNPINDNDISGLHESVLGTDPTGKEMRPF